MKMMKFGVPIILKIIYFITLIASSSGSTCDIANRTDCKYVVRCERITGSVSNPECDTEPYVTFVINHSKLEHITTGFFAATNFDSRVREIKSTNNQWTNIENSAFRYYPKCIRLDLHLSAIRRVNAEGFRHLVEMRFLNLSNNFIESFYPQSFFLSENHEINNLKELDISYNLLQYLGRELNLVPHLTKLYLQNNMISSIDDDAFERLQDLQHLNLQHNLLTSVNLSLTPLKNLETLDLSYNHIIKLSGYQLNRLIAIVDFNVSHNELIFVESNSFNQAFHLESADFSFNSIKTTIETIMFINNNRLSYLDFKSNKISTIQQNVFQYSALNYLNFKCNNITGDIQKNIFSNLNNITKLDLSNQSISGIRDEAFSEMRHLQNLNLSKNFINIIESHSFVNTVVTVLDLSHNEIPDLNFLQNCLTNLTELYLNNNNIRILPKYTFGNQTLIRKLDLSANRILSIEPFSLPLKNIQYLNVVGNQINGVLKQDVFSPAKYLRFLDLSYFNITQIDSLAFAGLPVMAKLNISNNNIKYIDVNSFSDVDNLYSLDISYNMLTKYELNSTIFSNLKALHFRNNNLTNISTLFTEPCKLTYLDLRNNQINDISEVGSDIYPNLTVLILDNNKIQHVNNIKTNTLSTLIDLSLASNNISEITLGFFKDLMSVDLSNNYLTYIDRTFLERNEYLQALDVSKNQIAELPPGTFLAMKNLKLLNMSSNYLSKLRYGSLKGLHKTEVLDLSKNKIAQLDVDIFHECDELKTLILDYNRLKTFDVERLILFALKKIRVLSLGGNPILCKEIVHNLKSANTTFYAIRQVEITSIDKVYHEDNVHGIQCGDHSVDYETTTNTEPDLNHRASNNVSVNVPISSTGIVLIWCSVLTVLLVTGSVIVYFKLYKKRVLIVNRNSVMQLRNSTDGSEFQNDLLS